MKSVCFVIDDVNFSGGAHVATFLLIRRLVKLYAHVEILTLTHPDGSVIAELDGVTINVMQFPNTGARRLICSVVSRVGFGWYPVLAFDPDHKWCQYLCKFTTVCCVGEPSILRWFTASLPKSIHKVMMIHTDYSYWRKMSNETRRISRFDGLLYGNFDVVGVVGKSNAEKMARALPGLRKKIMPFHNIIKIPSNVQGRKIENKDKKTGLKIVTLSRLEWGPPKNTDALIRVAAKLKGAGLRFDWDVYGGGNRTRLDALVSKLGVGDVFHMQGFSKDAQAKLAGADISVMLSAYEGLSNGIYESLILGVPVLATDVGGAAEQIQEGVTGWLVENDEDMAFEKLRIVLGNTAVVALLKDTLKGYRYDNDSAFVENLELLGLR